MLQFKFIEPIELCRVKETTSKDSSRYSHQRSDRARYDENRKYLREEHEKATAAVIKALKDSKFDCEYEVNQIMLQEQRDVDRLNELKRQEMTHNMQQYVEISISEKLLYFRFSLSSEYVTNPSSAAAILSAF